MCGIAGFIPMPGVTRESALEAVGRMTARLQSRGPDAEGAWASEGVVLGVGEDCDRGMIG